jgi:TrbL/VirB6 plasmid conjugal transfer protein
MAYTPMDAYTDAVSELSAVSNIWNPFQLVYVSSDGGVVNQWQAMIHSMQSIGLALIVLMASLKFVKAYLDELNHIPALTTIFGIAVEMVLVTVFLLNYTWFAEIFPSLFHKLTTAILDAYDASLMDQVIASLKAVGEEKSQETKWFSLNALEASIPNILSTAAAGLAMALYWVMSKYQALLYTFWYLIGPVLLPFYLFPPFRGVAERWFASLLGAAFMGVVGSIMFVLMAKAQWLTKAFSAGVNTTYITALVFSLLTLLLMFSIPRLSNSIWEGISSSLTQAMATGSMLGGAATAVAMGTVGGAVQATGSTIRGSAGMAGVIHRYGTTRESGLSTGKRVLDAIRNRDSFAREGKGKTKGEKVLSQVYEAGTGMRDMGRGVLMSQLPSAIQRADKSVAKTLRDQEPVKARRKEEAAVREHVAKVLGPDVAQAMTFPERWRLPQRVGQSFEESVAKVAASFLKNRKVEDIDKSLREVAAKLVGSEKAAAMVIPKNFRLKPRRGQSEDDALRTATLGLLRKDAGIDPNMRSRLDHEAIQRESVRILGAERAKQVKIPEGWSILPRKGQSPKEALEGSTRALLQKQGLIDQKDENKIAIKYRYALARKKRAGRKSPKKSGGNKK